MSAAQREYEVSLTDLLEGRHIKAVYGMVEYEFGDASFCMTRIVFTDGTQVYCEGEHDHPYITAPAGEDEYMARRLLELDPVPAGESGAT